MSDPWRHQIADLILQVLNHRADNVIRYVIPWKSGCLEGKSFFWDTHNPFKVTREEHYPVVLNYHAIKL